MELETLSKKCTRCGETKFWGEFYRQKEGKYGRQTWCKECDKEYKRLWPLNRGGRDKKRNQWLMSKYGITLEKYGKLHEKQGGVCAICGEPETAVQNGKFRPLSVDHKRGTKDVRGLLCSCCNTGIGGLRHSPHLLEAAKQYLKKHNGVQEPRG